jgi:hypothetical protein
MFTWQKVVWTFLEFAVGGTFVHANHGGLTHSYWLVPGTEN